MATKRKPALIGFDCFDFGWLEPLMARGYLPTIKKLISMGVLAVAKPPIFGATAENWCTIATGAYAETHQAYMSLHIPNTPLDERTTDFSSRYCEAEQIWTAANKAEKMHNL